MSLIARILVTHLVELVIGIPLAILFWPVTLLSWGLLRCIRFSVQFWLDRGNNGDVKYILMHGHDAVFGYTHKNNSNSVIPGYCVIEGKFDLELIFKRAAQMAAGNPKLKYRFTKKLGFYCWEVDESKFEIRNHVKMVTQPDEIVRESQLMEILEKLSVTPIDSRYPGWEVLLVPSFRCTGEQDSEPVRHYAQILRVHHSYGDGVSFCLTSNAFLFDKPAILPLDPKKPFPVPVWAMPIQYIKVVLLGPLYFFRDAISMMTERSKFSTPTYAPSKYMSRSATPISLAMLKKIKTNSEASVTSILISAISSSLKKTHERLFPDHEVPSTITTANVNAILPYPDDHIRNRFTIFPLYAPLSEADLKTRLEDTNAAGYRVTLGPSPLFCYFILKLVGELPSIFQNIIISQGGTPIMLSNIPGIVDTVKVFDGQCVDSGAWLPLIRATGIAIATYTYKGELRFCGMADPNVLPKKSDLQTCLDDIADEIRKLAQLYKKKPCKVKRNTSDMYEEVNVVKYVERYLHVKKA